MNLPRSSILAVMPMRRQPRRNVWQADRRHISALPALLLLLAIVYREALLPNGVLPVLLQVKVALQAGHPVRADRARQVRPHPGGA
jgi:hypothetical protein